MGQDQDRWVKDQLILGNPDLGVHAAGFLLGVR
jgi:hypothetical protein